METPVSRRNRLAHEFDFMMAPSHVSFRGNPQFRRRTSINAATTASSEVLRVERVITYLLQVSTYKKKNFGAPEAVRAQPWKGPAKSHSPHEFISMLNWLPVSSALDGASLSRRQVGHEETMALETLRPRKA